MQRHTTRWLALFLCTSALVACGDDTAAGGSSSGGNSNGGGDQGGNNTGAGNQGGDTNVGAGNQGGDGNGGAPNGGNGSGGEANGGNGSGGGANAGADGANCVDDADCDGGFCLAENLTGIPGGMCSEDCTASETCTSATSVCVQFAANLSACLKNCDPDTAGSCGAPATLNCDAVKGAPEGGICWGYCDMDSECTSAGKECHDEPLGNCAPPEICDNGMDDDFDGDADCADDECSAVPACAAGTCAAPTVLADAMVTSSTTVGGANALDSTCAATSGNEVVFTYTSAITGGLFVSMLSDTDQGIHVRTDCNDDASEVVCADLELGGTVESVQLPISAGQTVFVIVDAYVAGEEDSFQLLAEAFTEACDDLFDGDADGSADCADAPECNGTAACTPGATAQNGACTANNNCASTVGADPACLTTGFLGANANFCSEWCDPVADDCGGARTCVGLQGLNEGLCLTDCTSDAQCPANFDCTDIGAGTDFCMPEAPAAWVCDPAYFVDGFCDCGCGVFDPDCPDATAASCEYCDGGCSAMDCSDIDPLDNSTCN